MNNDDWNPHFQRRKKRNRVSSRPERRRRYYFWPIAGLVVGVFMLQSGVIAGIGRGAQAVWASQGAGNRERERQIEKMRMILATTDALLQQIEREQARRNGEQLQRQINEVYASGEGGVVTIQGNVTSPILLPATKIPTIEAVREDGAVWVTPTTGTVTIQTGTTTLGSTTGSNWTVHKPEPQPTPARRKKVDQE